MYHRLFQAIKPSTADLFSIESRCSSLFNILGCEFNKNIRRFKTCLMKFLRMAGSQTRTYNEGVNIEWVPPPKVSCLDPSKSGDKSQLPEVDLNRPQYGFSRFKQAVKFTDREE